MDWNIWRKLVGYTYLRNEHDNWGIQLHSDWRMTADLPGTFLSSVFFGLQNVDFYKDFLRFDYSTRAKLKSVRVVLSNCGAPSGR